MGLTKREKTSIGKDFDKLIKFADKLKSDLITLKVKLYIEAKDTQKKPCKRFRK